MMSNTVRYSDDAIDYVKDFMYESKQAAEYLVDNYANLNSYLTDLYGDAENPTKDSLEKGKKLAQLVVTMLEQIIQGVDMSAETLKELDEQIATALESVGETTNE